MAYLFKITVKILMGKSGKLIDNLFFCLGLGERLTICFIRFYVKSF